MNFLDKLKGFEHTFVAWITKGYQALYKDLPAIERVANAAFQYAIPAVQIIATAEAGAPAGALIGKIASQVQDSLHAAASLIYDFGATPTATSVVASAQANLSTLLSAGHITNDASVANVTKVINTLAALVAALPAPAAPVAPAPAQ